MNGKRYFLFFTILAFSFITYSSCNSKKECFKPIMDITHVIPQINYGLKQTYSLQNENDTRYVNNYYYAVNKLGKDIAENILSNDLISFANVTNSCSNHFRNFLKALIKDELWAIQIIDSFAKPPSGILQGTFIWTGEYKECMNVTVPNINWESKYCTITNKSSKATLEQESKLNFGFYYGICVHKNCTDQDIASILNELLKYNKILEKFSHVLFGNTSFTPNNVICQEGKKLDRTAIVAITIILIIISISLIATFLDVVKMYFNNLRHGESRNVLIQINEDTVSLNQNENQTMIIQNHFRLNALNCKENLFNKLISSFSIVNNAKKIFNTSSEDYHLKSLHGIRFISLSWVILGHTYGFLALYSDNLLQIETLFKRFSFSIIINGYYSVDSFFLLSGLLSSYMFMKEVNKPQFRLNLCFFIKYYIHRIWRLSPPYWLVLMFSAALTKYLGSGPMFPTDGFEGTNCDSNWWYNILYINNFGDPNKSCFLVSWYLANDMQFHLIAPLILIPLAFKKKLIFFLISILIIIGHVLSIVLTLIYNPGSEIGTLGPKPLYFSKWIYQKPWARIGPFIVGLLLGYLLFDEISHKQGKLRKKPFINIILWVLSILFTFGCLFILFPDMNVYPDVYYSRIVHILYQSFSRLIWAFGLAYIIYACETSNGGFINKLLTMKIWTPLSRLSYSAFLVHLIVILYFYSNQEHTLHIQDQNMIYFFVANLTFSFTIAFFLSTIVELPFIALERMIFKKQ